MQKLQRQHTVCMMYDDDDEEDYTVQYTLYYSEDNMRVKRQQAEAALMMTCTDSYARQHGRLMICTVL